ncbi:flavin reductase family protein, partial [Tritonibacter sp. SIMBA_163]|uniref:flavin reductase family protein n=1 Tax=Tritonibacter sp. SIMBA_163 TaxID=3080868 RepID=UPI0039814E7E
CSPAPPGVLGSPDRNSRRLPDFEAAEHYAIHGLAADQQDLCYSVAKEADGLRDLDLALNAEVVPVIEGCLARFECS